MTRGAPASHHEAREELRQMVLLVDGALLVTHKGLTEDLHLIDDVEALAGARLVTVALLLEDADDLSTLGASSNFSERCFPTGRM